MSFWKAGILCNSGTCLLTHISRVKTSQAQGTCLWTKWCEVQSTNLPKDAQIVVYCAGPTCPQSRLAAEKLLKLGYENVRAYEGGLEEWKAAGWNTEAV